MRSLPGAIAAYGLAVGISRLGETLPAPVYALLSGLNNATVGIIALASIQLSSKAVTDPLTRILVFVGGTAGMLYYALWYFPVLIVGRGLSTILWGYKLKHPVYRPIMAHAQKTSRNEEEGNTDSEETQTVPAAASQALRPTIRLLVEQPSMAIWPMDHRLNYPKTTRLLIRLPK